MVYRSRTEGSEYRYTKNPRNRSELRDVCAKRNQMGHGQGLALQQPYLRGICFLVWESAQVSLPRRMIHYHNITKIGRWLFQGRDRVVPVGPRSCLRGSKRSLTYSSLWNIFITNSSDYSRLTPPKPEFPDIPFSRTTSRHMPNTSLVILGSMMPSSSTCALV
jgi:hypothetical protein